jgi:hypothetical protein
VHTSATPHWTRAAESLDGAAPAVHAWRAPGVAE